jgi:hypothetical protein
MVFWLMFLTTIFKRKNRKQSKNKEKDFGKDMKKYVYFLQDSPNYPNEILASSASEVRSLILESIGADNESMILNIIAADEYYNKGKSAIYSDPNDYANSNDFFNSVINSGKKIGAALNEEVQMQPVQQQVQPVQQQMTQSVQQAQQIQQSQNVKYFEDNGIKYKLENGILYKNNWVPVDELSDKENYRIINNSTNRVVSSDKYRIEKLDWKEI